MLKESMQEHHKFCDDLFAAAEASVASGDWQKGEQEFGAFVDSLEAHFVAEEEILFPRYEGATGMMSGPTRVMRLEHQQMRQLVERMRAALARREEGEFAGAAQTLLIMMQQHNMKEENILYPMIEQALAAMSSELSQRLAERLRAGQAVDA